MKKQKRLTICALAAALLLSGMLMGVSYAGGSGITQPQVIELSLGHGGAGRGFPIKDEDGGRTGQMNVLREVLLDADGNQVGNLTSMFLFAKGVVWQDVATFTLKAGPHTEAGTVAVMGNFRGFNGESMAVTGGTGAYQNARGFVTLGADGHVLTYTLNLIP
jgi:dirigent-like protein